MFYLFSGTSLNLFCVSNQQTTPLKQQAWLLCKVTHCEELILVYTWPHQLWWVDQEMESGGWPYPYTVT